ncbi:MAG: 30S ribosomal protein S15 [Candidatus Woesearchaeota archaeon]
MARMHGRSKGVSGSSKPFNKENPSWVSYKPTEVEALVAKYAKDKLTAAQIGIKLRDMYGIPSVKAVTKKTITQILAEKKLTKKLPQDMIDIIQKWIDVQKHFEENKQDKTALRGIQLTQSKLMRLIAYYKKSGKLDADWKFNPARASMYIE